MENSLPGFPPFSPSENLNTVTQRWNKWKDKLDNYLTGFNITCDKRRRALLRHYIGDEVDDVFIGLPNTGTTYDSAIAALDEHFKSQQNTEFETYMFRQLRQEPNETLNQFVTRLRKQAASCGFADEDREIRSQIILGCTSGKLRRHALQQQQASLADLISFGRINETTIQQAGAIENKTSQMVQMTSHKPTQEQPRSTVDSHRSNSYNRSNSRGRYQSDKRQTVTMDGNKHRQANNNDQQSNSASGKMTNICAFCGEQWHRDGLRQCKAQGKYCTHCGKLNHVAKVCRKKIFTRQQTESQNYQQNQNTNIIQVDADLETVQEGYVLSNGTKPSTMQNYETVKLIVNNSKLSFIIDSGSTVNLLNREQYKKLSPTPPLTSTQIAVFAYGSNTPIPLLGMVMLNTEHNNKKYDLQFLVPQVNSQSLIGKDTAVKLGVIKFVNGIAESNNETFIDSLLQQHNKLFNGLGLIKKSNVILNIDEKIKPVIQKLRRVPYHLRIKVEEEIQDLLQKDIIEPVPTNEPTPWISPMVIVPKRNDSERVRLCIDMKEANRAILRERSVTPTVEDVMYRLNGARVFSKLDMNKGYHQLYLHPNSRGITTFVTHQGLYRYKRLHFGINTAAEIFQQEISKLIHGIQGVINISDDILVFGISKEEHNRALQATLKALEEAGVTLNKNKCLFDKTTLKFLGHVFSAKGVTPDMDKVKAIQTLQTPKNPAEVRSFLGMVTFTSRFLPSLSLTAKPLRQLTRATQPWRWNEEHQRAFDKIKANLSKATTLSYFDRSLKTEVWTDASPIGISAMLLQRTNSNEINIIAYASHALSDTEQKYSQIEREALALTWSTHHFHLYLYGGHFKIVTDHKPLVSLFSYNKHPLTTRLERWKLKLQPYNYIVEYSPGRTNPTDYMSRHPLQNQTGTRAEQIAEGYINFMVKHTIPRTMSADDIKQHTKDDHTLSTALEAITSGDWSRPNKQVNLKQWQSLKKISHELSTTSSGDIILRGPRIVLPTQLHNTVINIAHSGHQGIAKTKALLREKVWFPSMDRKTETIVAGCRQCNTVLPEKGGIPLHPSATPEGPWQIINVDHKGPLPNGKYLLVVIDQFSKFPLVETVPSTAAKVNISKLEHIFSTFGTPTQVITDNGSPFNSIDFAQFAKRLNFQHRRITPRWPQANGQVEKFNASINKSLKMSFSNNWDYESQLDMMLKDYRTTPHCSTGCAPSTLLFGYNLRSQIPDAKQITNPIDKETIHRNVEATQNKMVARANNGFRKLQELKIGDTVLVQNEQRAKTMPFYHIKPYIVIGIKGTMVTAQNDNHRTTRNRTFFRKIDAEEETSDDSTDALHDQNKISATHEEEVKPEQETGTIEHKKGTTETDATQAETNTNHKTTSMQNDEKRYNLRTVINKPKRLIDS